MWQLKPFWHVLLYNINAMRTAPCTCTLYNIQHAFVRFVLDLCDGLATALD